MLGVNDIVYSAMGKPVGLNMSSIIELVKMMAISDPVKTIEKVMYLSRELIRDGN